MPHNSVQNEENVARAIFLPGIKKLRLKPVPENVSASRLLMKTQSRLAKIANMDFVNL